MISSDDFGKFIAAKRKEFKISQVALAEKLNIDPKTLSKWENGTGYPDLESAYKIAEIFNVTLTDILSEEFDTEIINDKKLVTFDNIFAVIMVILSISIVILKNLNMIFVLFKFPILSSIVFIMNILSIIFLLVAKKKNKHNLLHIFSKIIYAITILVLFIL